VLPVHFELGIKYPSALRFDAAGNFLGLVRMSSRPYALQPTLLAQTPTRWLALLRDERPQGKVLAAQSTDGGQHWQDLPDLALDNPDASVGGMALGNTQLLLAHNSSPGSRAQLDLSHSDDGVHWTLLQTLEKGSGDAEYSYPAMAWADGNLWLSYTVDRQRLAWQRFAPQASTGGVTP
jgi:predicted neuraminidase